MRDETKICTFIGNAEAHLTKATEDRAKRIIVDLIVNHNVVEFFCGGYGDFDTAMAYVIKEMKNIYDIKLSYVTPYNNGIQQKKLQFIKRLKLYDEIIYPKLEQVPYRFALLKRNEWMIDHSDFAIAFVPNIYGGAYKTLQYAKNKLIIRLL